MSGPQFERDDGGERLSDRFGGRMAEQLGGCSVPTGDGPLGLYDDDGVALGIEDGSAFMPAC